MNILTIMTYHTKHVKNLGAVWILYLKVILWIFMHRMHFAKNLRYLVGILKNAKCILPRIHFAFSKIPTKHLRFFAECILCIRIHEITFKQRIQTQAKKEQIKTFKYQGTKSKLAKLIGCTVYFSLYFNTYFSRCQTLQILW